MKKCVQCGAENNSEFKYCKFCGAELPCVDQKVYREGVGEPQPQTEFSPESEDITIAEMADFVGKNSGDIVPRFIAMQKRENKISFCLPAFLLGLFFGLPGVAAWLLYRKMVKPASVLLLISALLSVLTLVFTFSVQCEYYSSMFWALENYNNLLNANPSEAISWLFAYMGELMGWLSPAISEATPFAVSFITGFLGNLAAPIIISFFSISMYKDFALGKISVLKRSSPTVGVYSYKLKREGGTSGGTAALGIILYLIATGIISLIPLFAVIIG